MSLDAEAACTRRRTWCRRRRCSQHLGQPRLVERHRHRLAAPGVVCTTTSAPLSLQPRTSGRAPRAARARPRRPPARELVDRCPPSGRRPAGAQAREVAGERSLGHVEALLGSSADPPGCPLLGGDRLASPSVLVSTCALAWRRRLGGLPPGRASSSGGHQRTHAAVGEQLGDEAWAVRPSTTCTRWTPPVERAEDGVRPAACSAAAPHHRRAGARGRAPSAGAELAVREQPRGRPGGG